MRTPAPAPIERVSLATRGGWSLEASVIEAPGPARGTALFVHGLGASSRGLLAPPRRGLVGRLNAAGWRAVLFDQRGHGETAAAARGSGETAAAASGSGATASAFATPASGATAPAFAAPRSDDAAPGGGGAGAWSFDGLVRTDLAAVGETLRGRFDGPLVLVGHGLGGLAACAAAGAGALEPDALVLFGVNVWLPGLDASPLRRRLKASLLTRGPAAKLLGRAPSGPGPRSAPSDATPGSARSDGAPGSAPFGGAPRSAPFGGAPGSAPFGGAPRSARSDGAPGSDPLRTVLGSTPFGAALGSTPFGAALGRALTHARALAGATPWGTLWPDAARWWSADAWLDASGYDYLASLRRVRCPALAFSSHADPLLCAPECAHAFAMRLGATRLEHHVAGGPGWRGPGHGGLVTDERAEPLWHRTADWLDAFSPAART